MMEPAILPAVTGLLGTLLGGIIVQLREWGQLARDRRRTLNRVLYTQLDVWNTVVKADRGAFLAAFAAALGRLGLTTDESSALAVASTPEFRALFDDFFPACVPEEIAQKYQHSVDELASVDPVLAFRLSGRPELARFIVVWREQGVAMVARLSTAEDQKAFGVMQPAVERGVRADLLEALEEDIEDVARSIGLLARRRTRRLIDRSRKGISSSSQRDLDEMMGRILSTIIPQVAPQHHFPGC